MGSKVLLWYDVEDYITEESDDALLALLDMMESRGVRGTFKFVGEKIRAVSSRGRKDILEKLSGQDIGYHTDMHSEHPTVSEYCEPLGFREGAMEFEKRESGGLADLVKITGMPVSTYGQPGAAWAPQVFPVLRKWGIPTYVDSNDMIDLDCGPFWYGGILTLTYIKGIMRMELEKDGLANAKNEFDRLVNEGEELISIYYHPCEFSTVEFWDGVNFNRGANTPRENWKRSQLREPGQMDYYINKLGEFVDYLLSKGCEFITISELNGKDYFGRPDESPDFTAADVRAMASLWDRDIDYVLYQGYSLSASEVFSLFKSYLCDERLKPKLIYGPEKDIATDPDAKGNVQDFQKALGDDFPEIFGFSQLPDFFVVNEWKVNPVDMACTLAYIIHNNLEENERVEVLRGSLASQRHINTNENWGGKWIVFPEDFKAPHLIETARLQAWTLKPAIWNIGRKG